MVAEARMTQEDFATLREVVCSLEDWTVDRFAAEIGLKRNMVHKVLAGRKNLGPASHKLAVLLLERYPKNRKLAAIRKRVGGA